MKSKTSSGQKIICLNRKASFNYFFYELIEAGISLKGSEVKSLRDGKGSIADSYAIDKNGELFLSVIYDESPYISSSGRVGDVHILLYISIHIKSCF